MNLFFIVVAILAVASALSVLFARHPVHAVLGLVAHFIALAALYLSLSAEFLAVIQVIIYGGGVMILFLFVVTLLTARPGVRGTIRQLPWLPISAITASIALLGAFGYAIGRSHLPSFPEVSEQLGSIANFADALFNAYVLPFEITAFVLLTAVIGVVVLVTDRADRTDRATRGDHR